AFQHEVDLARKHIAIAHDGRAAHALLERNEIGLGLAMQPDHGESRDVEAKRSIVEERSIAADEPGFLERADSPQARRRRDAYFAGKLHIGNATVGLQLTQDASIGLVEAGLAHEPCSWTIAASAR